MGDRALDYIALFVLITVVITFIYLIIFIHDIPYEIAKKRRHPHQDAIHTAGWVSLFLMHSIWPLLWIWATLYKPEIGWGFRSVAPATDTPGVTSEDLNTLAERILALEEKIQPQQQTEE